MPQCDLAANIRAELARRDKTQRDLAKHLGLPQQAISRRLAGITDWRVGELHKIADYLQVSVLELMGDG